MKPTLESAIAAFGAKSTAKLSNTAAAGQPEDQIRAPFEYLLSEVAKICHFPQGTVTAVGESSVSELKTRPDYAVSVHNALIGFIELKATIPKDWRHWHPSIASARRLATLLFRSWDDALLFRELATLRLDAPVFEVVDDLRWSGPAPAFEEWCGGLSSGTAQARDRGRREA